MWRLHYHYAPILCPDFARPIFFVWKPPIVTESHCDSVLLGFKKNNCFCCFNSKNTFFKKKSRLPTVLLTLGWPIFFIFKNHVNFLWSFLNEISYVWKFFSFFFGPSMSESTAYNGIGPHLLPIHKALWLAGFEALKQAAGENPEKILRFLFYFAKIGS